jgi:hypothetical protein
MKPLLLASLCLLSIPAFADTQNTVTHSANDTPIIIDQGNIIIGDNPKALSQRANDMLIIGNGENISIQGKIGDGNLLLQGSGINFASDENLKTDIHRLDQPLEKLSAINGVSFHWKEENQPGTQLGVIAQDVQQVFPELVYQSDQGALEVNYIGLIPVLIEAVKELKKKNTQLEQRLDFIEGNTP